MDSIKTDASTMHLRCSSDISPIVHRTCTVDDTVMVWPRYGSDSSRKAYLPKKNIH
ncbi:hypothetical protein SYJ56_23805 [Algoriphagus sp. D3-2-R+10]|uniref:hypothetical protein n=1 Tax=Algoriphagus aurantiacus TaxID=3103948 RepID=UPI002B393235|nr:hypothetical protein [Algoriphagus sp. D3-2-R+10]MEB2778355.1 hypothetical protein [Algoriphagus sp. D3-2-R+10]